MDSNEKVPVNIDLDKLYAEMDERTLDGYVAAARRAAQEPTVQENGSDEAIQRLKASGWTISATAFYNEDGSVVWVVSGTNGKDQIRAENPEHSEASRQAIEQAAALSMLAGWPQLGYAGPDPC